MRSEADEGTQVTCFTGTKVKILTQKVGAGVGADLTSLESIAGAGHNVHVEQPLKLTQALSRAMARFLLLPQQTPRE